MRNVSLLILALPRDMCVLCTYHSTVPTACGHAYPHLVLLNPYVCHRSRRYHRYQVLSLVACNYFGGKNVTPSYAVVVIDLIESGYP